MFRTKGNLRTTKPWLQFTWFLGDGKLISRFTDPPDPGMSVFEIIISFFCDHTIPDRPMKKFYPGK